MTGSIEQQAARWLSAKASGDLPPTDKELFSQWLNKSDLHRHAYERMAEIWRDLDWNETLNAEALAPARSQTERLKTRPPSEVLPRTRTMIAGLTGLAAACCLAWIVLPSGSGMSPQVELATVTPIERNIETATGNIQIIGLEDGTQVTLAGRSRLTVTYNQQERRVALLEGDAYFDVEPDRHRPFLVETRQLSVRVVGTEFEVASRPGHSTVSVSEGRVEILPSGKAPAGILRRGDRAQVDQAGVVRLSGFDPSEIAEWRDRRLSYKNTPLSDLVAEVNRYRDGSVFLASQDLHDLTVTTTFRTDQIDIVLPAIATSLGLDIMTSDTGEIILRHPPGDK